MIPRTADWKNALANAIRDPAELLALLELPRILLADARIAASGFPLRVPRGYLSRMEKGNLHDPLLRQVLPIAEENLQVEGYGLDPVGDLGASATPGLLHKYRGRVLLVATAACAIHCRYCFRRHFPYSEENPAQQQWQPALGYIRDHEDIHEVILSGGDPLAMDDVRLGALINTLDGIPHLRRLRIHTRLPVVLPERIDSGLLDILRQTRLQSVMVIHANHANELDREVAEALNSLHQAGITLLNQAVLLKGVNDDTDTLSELSEALFRYRVQPYYLHLLDKVQGAAHFDVPVARALELMGELRQRLPGYLVPNLVRELAGAPNKLVVA